MRLPTSDCLAISYSRLWRLYVRKYGYNHCLGLICHWKFKDTYEITSHYSTAIHLGAAFCNPSTSDTNIDLLADAQPSGKSVECYPWAKCRQFRSSGQVMQLIVFKCGYKFTGLSQTNWKLFYSITSYMLDGSFFRDKNWFTVLWDAAFDLASREVVLQHNRLPHTLLMTWSHKNALTK